MPEYLAPGVYVEEISTGPKPIEGVSTSTAGFVGPTERGPEQPRLIDSWLNFQRWYGRYIPDQSFLAYAIQGFFDNGGKRCFVGRVASANAVRALLQVGDLQIMAIGRGAWGNRVRVRIRPASQTDPATGRGVGLFRLTFIYYRENPDPFIDPTSEDPADLANPKRKNPDETEDYDNLSATSNNNNVITTVNNNSRLVQLAWVGAPAPLGPAPLAPLENGADGDPVTALDFVGDNNLIPPLPEMPLGRGRGLEALKIIDEISLLCAPDEVRAGLEQITTDVVNQCELLKDRFAVVSVKQGVTNLQPLRPPADTTYGAFYYPWIRIVDPALNDLRLIPPTGHITGIIARTDIERGVHKAPANEVVRGATDLEFPITKGMQDVLNPRGVNCIRDFRPDGRGIRLWGARTMSSDPEWKYINVRRLFLFVEESIDQGTQWVVFEPNDDGTWARVRRSITNFLISVWRSGALMGTTQDEAFFVKCDRTTMTQDDIDNGRLICYIGIAPVKPAEFVIFRISQKTADAPA